MALIPRPVDPLPFKEPIVTPEGMPTKYFMRQWLSQLDTNETVGDVAVEAAAHELLIAALQAINLTAGVGLIGGGDLTADRTFDMANTAVTPGTYGDASNSPQITIDAQGRITGAADVPISGGGGGGGPTLIGSVTVAQASAVNTIALDTADVASAYDEVYFVVDLYSDTTATELRAVFRDGGADLGGSTYDTAGELRLSNYATQQPLTSANQSFFPLTTGAGTANWDLVAGGGLTGRIILGAPSDNLRYIVTSAYEGVYLAAAPAVSLNAGGYFIGGGVSPDGIRIYTDNSANIYGSIKMLGINYA